MLSDECSGFRLQYSGFRVSGFGVRVSGFGCGVWGGRGLVLEGGDGAVGFCLLALERHQVARQGRLVER